ncbi:MAG: PAS domain-containing sensor histidine kinase [Pseudomonadota bacterium]
MTTASQSLTPESLDIKLGSRSTLPYARRLGVFLVVFAVIFGAASFVVLLGLTPVEPSGRVLLSVLAINALFVGLLIFLVSREVLTLIRARRRGRAAARMHIRIVGLFGIVAAFPAIIVAIVAGITLDLGLDRIFDNRTRTIVDNSISVAQSYVQAATGAVNTHAVNMGIFLDRNRTLFNLDRRGFENLMTGQARARGLLGAYIVRQNADIVVQARVAPGQRVPPIPRDLLESARDGKPSCLTPSTQNIAACAFKLKNYGADTYIYVLATVDPTVLNSIQLMSEITDEYAVLERGRIPLQIAFALLYVGICLTILLSAIWMGLAVADRLVEPIRRLITAADEVAEGNLSVSVAPSRSEGELRSLTETFNSMTNELRTQRDEILANQEQIDSRRRFTEAVLGGVTAGIIGVSEKGLMSIANLSAFDLLKLGDDDIVGKPLDEVSPELADVVRQADQTGKSQFRKQITILRGGNEITINVQVSADKEERGPGRSYVITMDDITDLVAAQRTSAWADVARRIAHEIKNPLTPIQLSAERIRRRYGKVITTDREVFDQCTDTIIRQVADIGRMVDEFSSFARMPKPAMTEGDLRNPVKEAVFLQKVSHPEIEFDVDLGPEPINARFDERLIGQAFGNLVKNATEAMETVEYGDDEQPRIQVRYEQQRNQHVISVIDNGKGLPEQNRQRLLEPYMTTREKGTGLGLAIVGKVLEEHHGRIELLDAPDVADGGRGAMVRVTIPVLAAKTSGSEVSEEGDGGMGSADEATTQTDENAGGGSKRNGMNDE